MPQMVLDVTPELQERVDFWCGETQQSPNILMLHALEGYLDDLEDEELAECMMKTLMQVRSISISL